MYDVPEYKAEDHEEVLQFVRQHPFATLVAIDSNNYPVATHVPLLLQQQKDGLYLYGHIMKDADHHTALKQNNHILAIFSGAHAYISARWYKNPHQASTWNYRAVHIKGELTFLDHAALLQILQKTTVLFEEDSESPTAFHNLPQEYTARLTPAIEAFEIKVTSVEHVFKMSQNKDEASYQNVISALKNGNANGREVAAVMQKKYDK